MVEEGEENGWTEVINVEEILRQLDDFKRKNDELSSQLDVYKPVLLALTALFACGLAGLVILAVTGQRRHKIKKFMRREMIFMDNQDKQEKKISSSSETSIGNLKSLDEDFEVSKSKYYQETEEQVGPSYNKEKHTGDRHNVDSSADGYYLDPYEPLQTIYSQEVTPESSPSRADSSVSGGQSPRVLHHPDAGIDGDQPDLSRLPVVMLPDINVTRASSISEQGSVGNISDLEDNSKM